MVEQEKWFYFAGGKVAKDIEDLVSRLKEISNEEFVFHVNGAKNDFANWIEGVFNHDELAGELRHVMERRDTLTVLKRFLHRQKTMLPGFDKDDLHQQKLEMDSATIAPKKEFSLKEPEELPEFEFTSSLDKAATSLSLDAAKPDVPMHLESPTQWAQESLVVKQERDLSGDSLKDIAEDASSELRVDGRMREVVKGVVHHDDSAHSRFIVKEFIYGFILGLIFGLIMLGTLMNINV